MSKGTKANSVDSGVGIPQDPGLVELMRELLKSQSKRDDQMEQERRDDKAMRDEERRLEKEA